MAEFIDMSSYYKDQLEHLKTQVENEKFKAEWDAAAKKLRVFYDSMINAGFTEEQAWWFVTAAVREAWGIS